MLGLGPAPILNVDPWYKNPNSSQLTNQTYFNSDVNPDPEV